MPVNSNSYRDCTKRRMREGTSTWRTAHHSSIFFVRTIMHTPAGVAALRQIPFCAVAVHIVQQNPSAPHAKCTAVTRFAAGISQ